MSHRGLSITDLLSFAVLTFVAVRLTEAARIGWRTRSRSFELLRGLRWRHFLVAVPVLGAIVVVFYALLFVPGLDLGWWTALGGLGNPVFGTTETTAGTPFELLIPIAFLVLLVPALPLLVWREEWVFRRGAEARSWWRNLQRAVLFGLAHTLVGIPIAAGLALSIGGVYFTVVYRRAFARRGSQDEALTASARAHLGYNLVIIGGVVAALAFEVVFALTR